MERKSLDPAITDQLIEIRRVSQRNIQALKRATDSVEYAEAHVLGLWASARLAEIGPDKMAERVNTLVNTLRRKGNLTLVESGNSGIRESAINHINDLMRTWDDQLAIGMVYPHSLEWESDF